ncbi:MAG: hypothetical protein KatS3mg105_2109 [Gemmatales bacterium]|nr:MAG: hypothetical protein KatS3mg105_2109 [Gemmatales bacterium]
MRKQLAKSQGSIASEASTSAEKPSVDTDSSAAPSAGVETKPIKIDDTLGTDVETIRSHIADLQAKQSPPPATSEIIQRLRTLREQLGQTSPLTKEGGNISGTSEQTTVPPPAPVDEDLDETVSSENLGGPENVAEEQDMEEMVDLSAPPAAEREGAAKTDPRIWMDDPEFNALPGLQDTGIADESMGWTHYGVEQPVDTNVTEIPGEEVEAVEFQSDDVLAGETDALSAETGQTFETPSEAMDTAWQTEDEVDLVELYGEENTAAEWNAPEEMVEEFVDEGEVEVVDEDENEAADRASAEEAEQLWEQADANPSDRRDAERVPVSLDVMCQPSIGRVEMRWRAKLRDLSYTGAQLVTDRRFEVGTILSIEVVKLGDEFTSLLARVMHVTEVPEGWALGCRFAKELSEKDMITLMEVSDI